MPDDALRLTRLEANILRTIPDTEFRCFICHATLLCHDRET
jgi:hypothetical protein